MSEELKPCPFCGSKDGTGGKTVKGSIDDKLHTLRHAIESGVKADSMQALKLMELVDDLGDRFKRELEDASGMAPELPTGWKAAPPIMTAAMSQAWTDALRDGKPTWPAVLAAMPSTDAAGDPALYMQTPAPHAMQKPVAWESPSTYAILRDESPDMCDIRPLTQARSIVGERDST
jgi:hypothetical protein